MTLSFCGVAWCPAPLASSWKSYAHRVMSLEELACPSLDAALRRMALHSSAGTSQGVGEVVSQPQGHSEGELALSLVWHEVAWVQG